MGGEIAHSPERLWSSGSDDILPFYSLCILHVKTIGENPKINVCSHLCAGQCVAFQWQQRHIVHLNGSYVIANRCQ